MYINLPKNPNNTNIKHNITSKNSLETIIHEFKQGIENKINFAIHENNSTQTNIITNNISSNKHTKQTIIQKILDIDYLKFSEKLNEINVDRHELEKLDYTINSNIVDIIQPILLSIKKDHYFKIKQIENQIPNLINIARLSSDITYNKFIQNPGIETLNKTNDKLNKITSQILPNKNSYYLSNINPDEFSNLQDKDKINNSIKILASEKIKLDIIKNYIPNNKYNEQFILSTIKNNIKQYDLNLDEKSICSELLNVFTNSDSIRQDIIQLYDNLNKSQNPKNQSTIEDKISKQEIKDQIKYQLKQELEKKFSINSTLTTDTLKKNTINAIKEYLTNIIQKEEFAQYVLDKTKIVPAINSFEQTSIDHILENPMNSTISKNILEKFYLIYETLENNLLDKSFDEFYEYLNKFEYQLNKESKGLKKIISGISKTINLQSIHYQTKYETFNLNKINNLDSNPNYHNYLSKKDKLNSELKSDFEKKLNIEQIKKESEIIKELPLTTKLLNLKAPNQTKGVTNKIGLNNGIEYGTINDIIRNFRNDIIKNNETILNTNYNTPEYENTFKNLFETLFESVNPKQYKNNQNIKNTLDYLKDEINQNIHSPSKTQEKIKKFLEYLNKNSLDSYVENFIEYKSPTNKIEFSKNTKDEIKENPIQVNSNTYNQNYSLKTTTKNITSKQGRDLLEKHGIKIPNVDDIVKKAIKASEDHYQELKILEKREKENITLEYKRILLEEKYHFSDNKRLEKLKLHFKLLYGFETYRKLEKTVFLQSA